MVMNATTYTRLLKDPKALHNLPLQDLKLLADRYPFAVGVQQLLLKKYQLKDENSYLAHLPLVALMSPDRKKLHTWVQATLPQADAEVIDMPQQVEEVLDEVVEEPTQQELDATRDVLHIAEEQAEPEVEETPEVIEEVPEPVISADEVESLEEDVTETVGVATDDEAEAPKFTGFPIPPLHHLADIAESINQEADDDIEEVIEAVEEPEVVEEIKEIATDTNKSFSDWLKAMKHEGGSEVEKQQEQTEVPDELEEIILSGSYEAGLMAEAQKAAKLEEAAKAAAPQQVEEDVMDEEEVAIDLKAKDSVKDHDENITETLAKIYELQKKYSKALDAYEKLIVKYPEKADYFRERIKLIENK